MFENFRKIFKNCKGRSINLVTLKNPILIPLYTSYFFPACGGPTPMYLHRDAIFISVTQKRQMIRPPPRHEVYGPSLRGQTLITSSFDPGGV